MTKKIPKRMCIACREMFDKRELKRIVRTPEGEIIYDPTGKKAGKGAYICSNPACFAKVKKSRLLDKTFKTEISKEVYEKLEEILNNEG